MFDLRSGAILSLWRDAASSPSAWFWSAATGWRRLVGPTGLAEACYPYGMNDQQEIVGRCGTAYLHWASPTSVPIAIQASGGAPVSLGGINNAGVIVGAYTSGRTTRAARWMPDGAGGWTMQDLGLVGGAGGINDEGGITVGYNGKAWYVAPDGGITELDPLSRSGGAMIYAATPGNRSADGVTWIVGYATATQNGPNRALWWRR